MSLHGVKCRSVTTDWASDDVATTLAGIGIATRG